MNCEYKVWDFKLIRILGSQVGEGVIKEESGSAIWSRNILFEGLHWWFNSVQINIERVKEGCCGR